MGQNSGAEESTEMSCGKGGFDWIHKGQSRDSRAAFGGESPEGVWGVREVPVSLSGGQPLL